ncbi:hypothetical protein EDB80DRAFT_834737 [Ilyonectria destructans]|nr:hypothetical protein EDB80DRAFT_834737 [Ilyonectria destructans]
MLERRRVTAQDNKVYKHSSLHLLPSPLHCFLLYSPEELGIENTRNESFRVLTIHARTVLSNSRQKMYRNPGDNNVPGEYTQKTSPGSYRRAGCVSSDGHSQPVTHRDRDTSSSHQIQNTSAGVERRHYDQQQDAAQTKRGILGLVNKSIFSGGSPEQPNDPPPKDRHREASKVAIRDLEQKLKTAEEQRDHSNAQLEQRMAEVAKSRSVERRWSESLEFIASQNKEVQSKNIGLEEKLFKAIKDRELIAKELEDERDYTHTLFRDLKDQEAIIREAQSIVVNRLSSNVSADFTDTAIAKSLTDFFDDVLQPWCDEAEAEQVGSVDSYIETLASCGLLATGTFSVLDSQNAPDPVMVIEAILADDLCQMMLTDAYYLCELKDGNKEWRHVLVTFEKQAATVESAIQWRLCTIDILATACPIRPNLFKRSAEAFVNKCAGLLKPLDSDLQIKLLEIFIRFAELTMRLWRLRVASIQPLGLSALTNTLFAASSPHMAAHPTTALPAGDKRWDGRPVNMVARPQIVSEYVLDGPKESRRRVTWSKASVWLVEDVK